MKTLKERLNNLQKRGHCEDVSYVKISGRFMLCRFADNTGGYIKKVSAEMLESWEDEADSCDSGEAIGGVTCMF